MTKPTLPTRLAALRLVPLALVSVALGALVATAACSSDPAGVDPDGGTSTDSDSGGGGGGGGGGNDSGFDSGLTKTKCPPYVGPSGKGTATAAFGTLADVPEITCRTLRKRDGSVAGFAASFGRFQAVHPSTLVQQQMDRIDRFEVTAFGNYTGDGELTTTRMDYKIQNAAGESVSGAGTLTLSEGGKKGVMTGADGATFTFECDPKDDTAPTAGPALTDAPGRAIIERERGGDATLIEGIKCAEGAPSSLPNLTISFPYGGFDAPSDGPCVPERTLIEAKVNGPGTYDIEPGSYVIRGLQEIAFVGTSTNGKTSVTLTGAGPAKGTFTGSTPSGAGGKNFNGSFTCPTP
jgi:hypothetical protein